ncbi:MAG TPA: hypothetical protein VKM94_21465 [Blastocatellia bacterium]|nr:hypothetical protein [Blastocatellia bacterium]
MPKAYGMLMCSLLPQRESFDSDEEFRQFVINAINRLSQDLHEFDIELSVKPVAVNTRRRHWRDWNQLQVGCE